MDIANISSARALDDLTLLDTIDDDSVVACLRRRFLEQNQIYTWSGPVLVAINPYKLMTLTRGGRAVPMYDDSIADAYRGTVYYESPPHPFAVAEMAYSSMLRYRTPSSITISGESGAGKTEACKQALLFLSRVSGASLAKAAGGGGKPGGKPGGGTGIRSAPPKAADAAQLSRAAVVKDRLLTSTLLLEAFGNAATLRNNNSSRFGKLMTVHFDGRGMAIGGKVDIYLLEKSRVVRQKGERSFHVLYYLADGLGGGGSPEGRALFLEKPDRYAYLSREHRKVPGLNDGAMWRSVVACMASLGIGPDAQKPLTAALAAVLALGNVELSSQAERDQAEDEEAKAAAKEAAAAAAAAAGADEAGGAALPTSPEAPGASSTSGGASGHKAQLNPQAAVLADDAETAKAVAAVTALLGVGKAALAAALTHRTISVGGTSTATILTAPQARAARDSLAKAIYELVFTHVVKLVNDSIDASTAAAAVPAAKTTKPAATAGGKAAQKPPPQGDGSGDAATTTAATTSPVGLDDVPAEPAAAGGGGGGVTVNDQLSIRLLDLYGFETFPDPANQRFASLLINYVNEKLQALYVQAVLLYEQQEYDAEGIGWAPVEYFDNGVIIDLFERKPGVFGLLDDMCLVGDATDDKLLQAFDKQLGGASEYYLPSRVRDGTWTIQHYAGTVTYTVQGMLSDNRDTLFDDLTALMVGAKGAPLLQALFADKRRATAEAGKGKRPPTSSQQFRASVAQLIDVLQECAPHYVRCIKPNSVKAALTVEDELFANQVAYLGIVEGTRVKRAGFAYRATYEEVLARYRMLSKITWPPRAGVDAKSAVLELLKAIAIIPKPAEQGALGVGMAAPGTGAGRGGPIVRGRGRGRGGVARGGAAGGGVGRGKRPVATAAIAPKPGAAAPAVAAPAPAAPAAPAPAPATVAPAVTSGVKGTGGALPGDVGGPGTYALREGVDYQLGVTKLFIKEPRNLFALEYMRSLALGKVVSRIAALWRAHAGKREYARIRSAWARMQTIVRAHLLRARFVRMRKAAVRAQAAVRGLLVRRTDAVESLRQTLGLSTCFGGKTRRRLSARWEVPPHGDFAGLFVRGTSAVAHPSVGRKLAGLHPPQAPEGVLFADYVVKVRQTYKLVRRLLVVTTDYLLSFNADGPVPGSLNRAIPIADIERVSLSRFRDSYVVVAVRDSYAFVCVAEAKVALVRALAARYRAVSGGGGVLPVDVGDRITYRAYKGDAPDKARALHFQQVPDAAVFEAHAPEPALVRLAALPGGLGGGSGVGGAGDAEAAGGGGTVTAVSAVQAAYARAERYRPFHTLQPDRLSLVVAVPVPPKLKLVDLLSPGERDKLRALGVRGLN